MARLGQGGFEGGHVHADGFTGSPTSGATANTDATNKRSGNLGLALVSGASGDSNIISWAFTGALGTAYYGRVYFMVTALPTAPVSIIRFRQTSNRQYAVHLQTNGALRFSFNDVQIGSDSAAINLNQWYRVGLKQIIGSGSGDDSGEFLLDGVSIASESGATRATLAATELQFGWVLNQGPGAGNAVYLDDWALNDGTGTTHNTWPGVAKTVHSVPTADNARAALWTGGTGGTSNLFEAVNNAPPIGTDTETDLTQIEHAGGAAGTTDAYDATMQSYAAAGLVAGDVIMAIQPILVHGEDIATGTKLLTFSNVSNPAIAAVTNFSAGNDAGAVSVYPSVWKQTRGTLAVYPTVTLATAPVMRVTRPETATRVASVCYMALQIEYKTRPVYQRVPPVLSNVTTAANTRTVTPDASVAANDLLIAIINAASKSTTVTAVPTGWTLLQDQQTSVALGNRTRVYYKIATGSEGGVAQTWTLSANQLGSTTLFTFVGADTSSPFDVQSVEDNPTSATTATHTGLTPTVANTEILFWASAFINGSALPPIGMVEQSDQANSNTTTETAWEPYEGGTVATGARTATLSVAAASITGLIVIKPAGTGGAAHALTGAVAGTSAADALRLVESQDISGALVGTSTASALRIIESHALTGSVTGTSAVAGSQISEAQPLASTVAGTASAAATRLDVGHILTGAAAGTALATATRIVAGHALAGPVTGTAQADALRLVENQAITGATAGASLAAATQIIETHALAGAITGTAQADALRIVESHALAGSTTGTSAIAGSFTVPSVALDGAAVGTALAAATRITESHALAGAIAATSTAAASQITEPHALAGSIAGTSAATASAINLGPALAGASVATALAAATRITEPHALAGGIAGTSAAASTQVTVGHALTSNVVATSAAAAPYISEAQPLAGAALGTSTAAGLGISESHAMAAASAGTALATASALNVGHILSGSVVATSTVPNATLLVGGAFSGAVAGTALAAASALNIGHILTGAIAATSAAAGSQIAVGHALAGAIAASGVASGLGLTEQQALTGAAIGTSALSTPALSLPQPLAGSVTATSTSAGSRVSVGHALAGAIAAASVASAGSLRVGHALVSQSFGTAFASASALGSLHALTAASYGFSSVTGTLFVPAVAARMLRAKSRDTSLVAQETDDTLAADERPTDLWHIQPRPLTLRAVK